jgi:hypothetical protein
MKKLEKLTLKELSNLDYEIPILDMKKMKGGEVTIVFDRSDNILYIYADGSQMGSFDASNNVASSSQGTWTNGTYSMIDQNSTHTHNSGDTYEGSYGINGIYRANTFVDANGCTRTGMGIHAGRSDDYEHPTMGCIRTTEAAMNEIQCNIDSYGGLTSITVQD